MSKKNLRYIVGIIVVMMVSVLALGGCKKNKDKDKENAGVEGGLQVEESGEGDSIDFEDFLSDDEEDDKTDTDKDGTPDKEDKDDDNDGTPDKKDDDDNNDGTPDKEDPKHPSYEGDDKEDNKEDNKDDDKEDNKDENVKDDEETGWSPFF
jgi:hypothetical protein